MLGVDNVYTIAYKWDDEGNLISGRHGRCQPSPEELRRQTDEAFAKVKAALGRVRTSLAAETPITRELRPRPLGQDGEGIDYPPFIHEVKK